MDRIAAPGNVSGLFAEGNPFQGVPATIVSSPWLNGVQEELLSIIEAAGVTPNQAATNQVLAALLTLFGTSDDALLATAAAPLESGHPLPDSRHPIVLLAQSGVWAAGVTTEAPTQGTSSGGSGPGAADNTTEGNEYDTSLYPGDAWPFTVPSALMAHDTAGAFPAARLGTNVNFYRHGFLLPAGLFVNGARLEVELSGTIEGSEAARVFEAILEPDYDPDGAYTNAEAFPFHCGPIAAPSGEEAFRFTAALTVLGFDDGTNEWIVLADATFRTGNTEIGNPTEYQRTYERRIPIAKADLELEDTLWSVRFKTDDFGSTLGDEGNSSGSTQDGSASVITARHYSVTLYPGGH